MTIMTIGQEDSGKSTILGHLLCICSSTEKQKIEDLMHEAEMLGKSSHKYAFILDKLAASKKNFSDTCDIKTNNFNLSIYDEPHRYVLTNMIYVISRANSVLLMMDASSGAFEASISKNSSAREHVYIAYMLGVNQLIIAVNKMDDKFVAYSHDRFNEIKQEVSRYLKQIGYHRANVQFIPISALKGDNLIERSSNMPWYDGPTLIQAFDNLIPPEKHVNEPLRICIKDIYEINDAVIPVGKVMSGVIKPGMNLCIAPLNKIVQVVSIQQQHKFISSAQHGDTIGFHVSGVNREDLKSGYVCGGAEYNPPRECIDFVAKILILGTEKIQTGYASSITCHYAKVQCKIEELISKIDRNSGTEIEKTPFYATQGDVVIARCKPVKALCVESFNDFPSLGRFILRNKRRTIATGIIISVNKT
jgi:elongation factor 1-alpha